MNVSPLAKVLSAVSDYRRCGEAYQSRCPAHEDHNPSLSVAESENGTVLLKCHAGCSTEAIVARLGLKMRDLFAHAEVGTVRRQPRTTNVESSAKSKTQYPTATAAVARLEKFLGKKSASWTYTNADGIPIAVVSRWDIKNPDGTRSKTFRPVAKFGSMWRIGDPDGLWPLYRLPAVIDSTSRIYVCEGEKAADALSLLGLRATTSAHGAKAPTKTDWTPLAGREIIILPDNDDPGLGYAAMVFELLSKLTPRPRIKLVHLPGLPAGGDAVEFISDRRKGVAHG